MPEHPNAAIVRSAYQALERGDIETFASLLDENILWHESTSGLEGDYQGRDNVLAFLGRVFADIEMNAMAMHDILASDDHTVVLHETTMTKAGRSFTGQYADVYHLRDGKLSEHWHLAVDPKADEDFMRG